MMIRDTCPKCKKLLISAIGPSTSKVLIVSEFPGQEEIVKGIPFCGKAGDVLRYEAARAGLNLDTYRITHLWKHGRDEEHCDVTWHRQALIKEFSGKSFILMLGGCLTEVFFDKGIMDLSGMEVKSEMFPKQRIFISVSPTFVFNGPVGELRLSLLRFSEAINNA